MKAKRFAGWLLFAVLALALGSVQGFAAGAKARAALEQAMEAAKQWQADAVLTNVSSMTVNPDGTAGTWFYSFYSPKKTKYMNVTASGRQVETLEVMKGLTDPLALDFIDSDVAMQEAKKYGIKGESPSMGLTRKGWAVNGGFDPGNISVWLNAKTGAFLRKEVIPKY